MTALLALLSDTEHVRIGRSGATLLSHDAAAAVSDALERVEERERIDQSGIEMMRSYAETRRCRRRVLLGYFGDELHDPCGNCDTCAARVLDAGEDLGGETDSVFQVDDQVRHREWGAGTMMSVEDARTTVFFEAEGYRVLSLELIEEKELLERMSSPG